MGRWSLSRRVVGKIRDKVYELPHGRYSKVAMDIKELGLGKGRTGETAWSPLGTALLARLSRGNGELRKDFKQERHVVRSGF